MTTYQIPTLSIGDRTFLSSGDVRTRQLHRVNELLTLYLQRRWEAIDWGGFTWHGVNNWDGLSALLAPLPTDEASRQRTYRPTGWAAPYEYRHYEDYNEAYLWLGLGTMLSSYFLTPQILNAELSVLGTGYACVKISSWAGAAGGIASTQGITVRLMRYSETKLIDEVFRKTWGLVGLTAYGGTLQEPLWDNTALVETKRSYFLELPDLDFVLDTDQRLAIEIRTNINARTQDCYFRHLFKRGEPESYIQLPVIEA